MTRDQFNCIDCDWPTEWRLKWVAAEIHMEQTGHRVERVHRREFSVVSALRFLRDLT